MKPDLLTNSDRAQPVVDPAKTRLLAQKGDPLVVVDWHALFFNFVIDPNILRGQIPPCFELELHDGRAAMSLVALSMRNFRPHSNAPWFARGCELIREQKFLNLRAYVRCHGEPGVLFLWGWLSRPAGLPLPDEPLGLTCSFADICYSNGRSPIAGQVKGAGGAFTYVGNVNEEHYGPCAPGSLSEVTMERYTGFYWHKGVPRVFRAWHEPWQSVPVEPRISDLGLVTARFPWFKAAELREARLCAKCPGVWLGGPHRLAAPRSGAGHGTASFFRMP
jgi:uncharacterized protein